MSSARQMSIATISIHAPPRGATLGIPTVPCIRLISIHAPPRGATGTLVMNEDNDEISIHAPPRGATPQVLEQARESKFQFTPLREGRHDAQGGVSSSADYFNSRPSARGDFFGRPRPPDLPFQFTPLREGRPDGFLRPRAGAISIHAPPRGATGTDALAAWLGGISIHAPPRGATSVEREGRKSQRYFNSRPSARGDPGEFDAYVVYGISIHAPPRGATTSRTCGILA